MTKNRYKAPKSPSHGYAFVAAGMSYKDYGIVVYVKYKAGPVSEIRIKQVTDTYVWVICPDRELVIVVDTHNQETFYPWGDSFDECHDFNVFNDHVMRGMDFKYIMTNFVHSPNSMNKRTTSAIAEEDRATILSDSGGLQLARGGKTAIDPEVLATFYNNNVDAGMVLDVPLAMVDHTTTMRAARVQKLNNEILLSTSRGVELINIFHGFSDQERAQYREIVEDERIPRVAIGGLRFNSMLSAMDIMYSVINGGIRYKQYHVLGVFISCYLPLLVKIANTGPDPVHITSDSTSHLQSAMNKRYHFQFDLGSNSKRLSIGAQGEGGLPNTRRYLPCQCPVCSVIKYTDVLGFIEHKFSRELLAIHNAFEMNRYTTQLQEMCEELPPKEYNKVVRQQLHRHPELREFTQCLDFIEIAAESQEKARRKYSSMLNRGKEVKKAVAPQSGLFGDHSAHMSEGRQKLVLQLLDSMERKLGVGL